MAAQTSLSWESFSSLPSLGKLRALSPCTKIVGNIICFCYNNSVSLDTKISESFDFSSFSESFSLFELKRCKVYKINNRVNYIYFIYIYIVLINQFTSGYVELYKLLKFNSSEDRGHKKIFY